MSWQEKVERYKAEQQKEQKKTIRLERRKKLEVARERIPPLLEVLERLNCKELLLQIRDEIWKLGEVSTTPDLGNVTPETPIEASCSLITEWQYYVDGCWHHISGWDDDYNKWIPAHKKTVERCLSIKAVYDESNDGILIELYKEHERSRSWQSPETQLDQFRADEPNAQSRLEASLIADIIARQESAIKPPYDEYKREEELAEKTRLETDDTQTSKGGFWKKLFGE